MGAKPSSEAAEPDHFVDSGDDISVRDGNFSDAGTEITDPMDLQPHPPAEDDTPTCLAQRMTIVSSKSCRACEDYAKASVGAMPACAVCGEPVERAAKKCGTRSATTTAARARSRAARTRAIDTLASVSKRVQVHGPVRLRLPHRDCAY